MKTSLKTTLCWLFCLAGQVSTAYTDDRQSVFEFSGLAFGDAYLVASHHTPEGDGAAGVVLRRLYLTLDANFSTPCSGRLRLETNQDGEFEVYEFETDAKDLHLDCKIGRHRLVVGLAPTPTFNLIEKIWGARHLMRTPVDLQGVSSRDTGVYVSGPINQSGSWRYRAMYGSGIEFGSDSSDIRKWMAAVTWKPSELWTIDLYADSENSEGSRERSMLQAFVAYQSERFRLGAQYSHQDRQDDPELKLASLFAAGRIGHKTELIGRIDRLLEPSPRGNGIAYLPFDPSARATLVYAGLETQIARKVSITPNVVYINYDENDEGATPKPDLHLRLTLYFRF